MGAPDVLARLAAEGIRLSPLPDGRLWVEPAELLTDELRGLIRAHRADLIAAIDAGAVSARSAPDSWALDVLDAHPDAPYGAHVDTTTDPVRVVVAIRGIALCEVLIPRERWDGVRFLELLEKLGGSVDPTRRTLH